MKYVKGTLYVIIGILLAVMLTIGSVVGFLFHSFMAGASADAYLRFLEWLEP